MCVFEYLYTMYFLYFSQPLLFLTCGPNEAAKEIRQFAADRTQKLDFFSTWDVKVDFFSPVSIGLVFQVHW